jgi:hypothetical protein
MKRAIIVDRPYKVPGGSAAKKRPRGLAAKMRKRRKGLPFVGSSPFSVVAFWLQPSPSPSP